MKYCLRLLQVIALACAAFATCTSSAAAESRASAPISETASILTPMSINEAIDVARAYAEARALPINDKAIVAATLRTSDSAVWQIRWQMDKRLLPRGEPQPLGGGITIYVASPEQVQHVFED